MDQSIEFFLTKILYRNLLFLNKNNPKSSINAFKINNIFNIFLFQNQNNIFMFSLLFSKKNKNSVFSFFFSELSHFIKSFIIFINFLISSFFWNKARVSYYVNNWIYTTNHKRIAINYFWFVILAGIVGMVLATVIRLEFAYPGVGVFAGDSIQYLSLASAHGVIMVFFMIMPLLFGAFANFLLPTQLGVHDVAFPRLNSAAFWFLPGGLLMLCQLVCVDRRYQRMNCFNIREVQSLLKRKFFTDLINTKDHHELLNKTSIGVRFKTNNINSINGNIFLSYLYGIETSPFIKQSFYNFEIHQSNTSNTKITFSNNSLFYYLINQLNNFNFFFYLNNFFFSTFYANWNYYNYNSFFQNFFKNITLKFLSSELTFQFFINKFTSLYVEALNLLFFIEKFFKSIFYFHRYVISLFYALYNFVLNTLSNIDYWDLFKTVTTDQVPNVFFKNAIEEGVKDGRFLFYAEYAYKQILIFLSAIYEFFFVREIFNFFSSSNQIFFLKQSFSLHQNLFSDFLFLVLNNDEEKISKNFKEDDSTIDSVVLRLKSFLNENNEYFSVFYVKKLNTDKLVNFENSLLNEKNNFNSFRFLDIYLIIFNLIYFFYWMFLSFLTIILWFFGSTKETSVVVFNDFFYFFSQMYSELLTNNFIVYFVEHNLNFKKTETTDNKLTYYFIEEEDFNNDLTDSLFSVPQFFLEKDLIVPYTYVSSFFYSFFNFLFLFFNNISFFFSNFIENFNYIIFDVKTFNIFTIISNYFFFSFKLFSNKINFFHKPSNIIDFNTNYLNSLNEKEKLLLQNEETNLSSRNLKFNNPIFKYDYKSGDYFPKLYKEVYAHLYSSILDLTSGLRTSPWFFSNNTEDLINANFELFISNINKNNVFKHNNIHNWSVNKFYHTDAFYNFFHFLNNHENQILNFKYISVDSLNNKFQKMFLTSSLQQRIYSNWRQLKFTREAWRCKLLAARHQKTLFRRYVNEDGVFWSIERNAKDLIPGWAMITPFSSRTRFTAIGKTDIGLMGVLLVLNSSIISGANFLVTYRYLSTLNNRKMRDARAFFTEAVMVASWMMILANPMLVIGIIMLLSDRHWQTSFFDYSGGGDTVLFQHMFWFFGHPEVYIIIIPTFGFTNTMISYYLKKRVSARASLLYSLYTIAFLGFFVWGHHMYMVGLAHTTRMLFSTLTVMISVPAATKIMHWCVTTVNSSIMMELPLLFTFTFIFFFVSGGISGMCVAHTGMDVLFHDTFYVIGHFHVMLAGGAMFASFGAFYFYFPAIFGVKYSRIYAYLHYTYYLIGQLMTVIPMFWLGYAGMPRRVLDYPASFGGWHSVISAGHMLNVAGLMAFFIMIFDSLRQGRAATRNSFGISRFNTRLNFYIYEIARTTFLQQKTFFIYKQITNRSLRLNKINYRNYEPYELVLISYTFIKK